MEFPTTTIWTRILEVRKDPGRVHELVVRRYGPPIFDFARRQSLGHQDAEDVVQEVFLRVCTEEFLSKADRDKGKFRTLLLAVARHVIASWRRRELAGVRDRRRDVPLVEGLEVSDGVPDAEFDKAWAANLVKLALEKLEGDPSVEAMLQHMKGATCRAIGAGIGRTEHAVENMVHRAKERVRREIERLIRDYSFPGQDEEELRTLLKYL